MGKAALLPASQITDSTVRANAKIPSWYRPELDVVRFAGFLLIFAGHAYLPSPTTQQAASSSGALFLMLTAILTGSTALNFFFVLSAYVITGLLMRERQRKGRINLGAFYYRRILRLWPLYLSTLVVSYLAGRVAWGSNPPAQYLADALFVGNWFAYPVNTPLPIWHLWSVSVEEQFYLIIPVVAAFASPRTLKLTSYGTILLGSLTLLFNPDGPGHDLWHNSFNQFIFFAAGVLVALRYPIGRLPQWSTGRRFAVGIASIFLVFAVQISAFLAFGAVRQPNWALMLIFLVRAACCAAFLVAVLGIERKPPNAIVFLGRLTFGLYVFHLWVIELVDRNTGWLASPAFIPHAAKAVLMLALTILVSLASYFLLERPFLLLKDKFFTIVHSRPV